MATYATSNKIVGSVSVDTARTGAPTSFTVAANTYVIGTLSAILSGASPSNAVISLGPNTGSNPLLGQVIVTTSSPVGAGLQVYLGPGTYYVGGPVGGTAAQCIFTGLIYQTS